MKVKSAFSKTYHRLLPDLVTVDHPREAWADCDHCHHCSHPKLERFHTKCCDFHPSLPNYIIGAILYDPKLDNGHAHRTITEKIRNKVGVTPFGVVPPLPFQKLLHEDRNRPDNSPVDAAERKSLLCPYYDGGGCSIYEHRSDVCGSYYCVSVGVGKGRAFWNELITFTRKLDLTLSGHIAQEMGFESAPSEKLKHAADLVETGSKPVDMAYQALWQNWAGKEVEYYKACYALVNQLSPESLDAILGGALKEAQETILGLAQEFRENVIPERLLFNEDQFKRWYQEQDAKGPDNSLELFLLRLFDGKQSTKKIVLQAEVMRKPIKQLLPKFIENQILVEIS